MDGTAPADDPVNQMIFTLRRLNSTSTASSRVVGETLGLKNSDFATLDALSREGPQAPTESARHTRTYIATMTGILAWLEGDGQIERRPDPADHRSVRIHAVGADRLIEVYFRVNEELTEHASEQPMEQMKIITRFPADAGDIVATFSERMTTERESQGWELTPLCRASLCPQRGSNP